MKGRMEIKVQIKETKIEQGVTRRPQNRRIIRNEKIMKRVEGTGMKIVKERQEEDWKK